MISREALGILSAFIFTFVAGIALLNIPLIALSSLFLTFLLIGINLKKPAVGDVRREISGVEIRTGEEVHIKVSFEVKGGRGVFRLRQPLPKESELISGANLISIWKGKGDVKHEISMRVRFPLRGRFKIKPVEWETFHPLLLSPPERGRALGEEEIEVKPRIWEIKRIRGSPHIAASPYPVIDIAKMGIPSTDFREIRTYVPGDPLRFINWKASARFSHRGKLLVNEFEVEGKRAIWVFLDGSPLMGVGTSIENPLEYAIESALGIIYSFVERGYRVGLYIFYDGGRYFYPDAGRRHFFRIWKELGKLGEGSYEDELSLAVKRTRKFLLNLKPHIIVITRSDSELMPSLLKGVSEIKRMGRFPITVIGISGYSLLEPRDESELLALQTLKMRGKRMMGILKGMGVRAFEWDPKREDISRLLIRRKWLL